MSLGLSIIVAFYIRVSTKMQAEDGWSLDAQLTQCIARAKQEYGPDVQWQVFVDEGISGKSQDKRRGLNKMMKAVRSGQVQAVMAWKVSRLARNLTDALLLVKEIDDHEVTFISLKEGKYGDTQAKLAFNILSAVAEYQREELGENVQLGMTQRASEGYFNGGIVLGYKSVDKVLTPIPEEAAVVRLIFNKCVQGWGTKKITNYLNANGYLTKKGNLFRIDSVARILRNPVYKGFVRFNQVIDWEKKRRKGKNDHPVIAKGVHEPIIDEKEWEKAQEQLDSRSTGLPRQYSGTFPLTGLPKCPQCGSFMTSMYGSKRKNGSKARYYVCGKYHNSGKSACGLNLVNAERLEADVWERLIQAMTSDKILEDLANRINVLIQRENSAEHDDESEHLIRRIKSLEEQKRRIHEGFQQGIFTAAESTEYLRPIRDAITNIESELMMVSKVTPESEYADLQPVTPAKLRQQLQEFEKLRNHLDVQEFRRLLVTCIRKVEIQHKSLKQIHFSFVVGGFKDSKESDSAESDPEDPLHQQAFEQFTLYKSTFCPPKRHLSMIRFPPRDAHAAVQLLR